MPRNRLTSIQKMNQLIFGPHAKPKSVLTPHKKQVKFDPDAKTKPIRIRQVKLGSFGPHQCNQVNFDPTLIPSRFRCTNTKPLLISILTLKPSDFGQQHKNRINADLPHWNEGIFDTPRNNQVHSIPHWNQVMLDPSHWNQVNSHHPHKTQVNLCFHSKI